MFRYSKGPWVPAVATKAEAEGAMAEAEDEAVVEEDAEDEAVVDAMAAMAARARSREETPERECQPAKEVSMAVQQLATCPEAA